MDDEALESGLAALSQFFLGDRTVLQTLERVAEAAIHALPQASFAGMTMMERGRPATSVFTDPASPAIDQSQYATGSGPCLDSFRTDSAYTIDSTVEERRWPEFCRTCVEHGVLSTLSVPLTVEGTTHGALNLYSRVERAFGATQVHTATLFAAQAAIVVANAAAYWSARSRAEQLERALTSRAVIEQAKGIIMAATRCSADDAFATLVQQSQQQNIKLHDIAAEIVANATRRD